MIRYMKPSDAYELAKIKMASLQHNIFSKMGYEFLEKFYFMQFYSAPDGFIIVSEQESGIIEGFVAGSADYGRQSRYVNLQLLYALIRCFARNPLKMLKLMFLLTHDWGHLSNVELKKYGRLCSLAVSKEHRGRGIGSLLTESLIDELRARGVKNCYLTCIEDNYNAMSLYKKHGFVVSHTYDNSGVKWALLTLRLSNT